MKKKFLFTESKQILNPITMLEELIEISRFYGKRKDYVISGGGNTSFKNESKLWVKASGITLNNIKKDEISEKSLLFIFINKLLQFLDFYKYLPKVIAIESDGIIALEGSDSSSETVLDIFEDMMQVSLITREFGGPKFMTEKQIQFIDNWEVENYRRNVAKS